MSRLRRLAIVWLAASTVAVGSLAVPATASAMPMSCTERLALSYTYYAAGNVWFSVGNFVKAANWYGKAEAILAGCT